MTDQTDGGVSHAAIPSAEGDPRSEAEVETAILALLRIRGDEKSICPTEAARVLAGAVTDDAVWRRYLPAVRRTALALARSGTIDILRKGKVIAPDQAHGVIRLRIKPDREETR